MKPSEEEIYQQLYLLAIIKSTIYIELDVLKLYALEIADQFYAHIKGWA